MIQVANIGTGNISHAHIHAWMLFPERVRIAALVDIIPGKAQKVKEKYGGILCDIGSHQIEQYLHFAGEEDAAVSLARIGNYAHPEYPELDDFGDCTLTGAKGTTNYFRVDWFTPDGQRTWGDGRTLILGTEGYIEIRKYVNIGTDQEGGDHVFLVNGKGEQYINAAGKTGFPFFGGLILDCLNRTEKAMTQAHAFKAAELCLKAQEQAVAIAR